MRRFLHYLNHRNTGLLALSLALVGMIYGKFILSVGTILLFAHGLVHPEWKKHLQLLWKHKGFLAFVSIFILWGFTGFWSDNTIYWLDRMKMKLPFVAVPFGLLAMKDFDRNTFDQLMYGFFWLVTLTTIGAIFYSFTSLETILENYKKGQVLPLPTHHIRFSLMVVFCICLGFYFYSKKLFYFKKWEPTATLVAIIFLIVFLHFLAVRSGLLAFYAVVIFYLLKFLFLGRSKMMAIGLIALFLGGSFLFYKYIPTLNNKVDYTLFSVTSFTKNKEMRDLSDSRRLGSLLAGVELTQEYPLLGVGFGDLLIKSEEWMAWNYPDLHGLYLMPHNQFLFVSAGAGLLGLLWFLFASFIPFLYDNNWRDSLFWVLNIVIFASYIPEHTIETQVGIATYVFPVVMLMRANLQESKIEPQEQPNHHNNQLH